MKKFFLLIMAIALFSLTANAYAAGFNSNTNTNTNANTNSNVNTNTSFNTDRILSNGYSVTKDDVESYPSFLAANKYYVLGFAALLAGSFAADKGIRGYSVTHQNSSAAKIASNIVYPFGKFYYMLPAAGLLSAYGYYSKNYKLTSASLTSLESAFVAGALTEGIKVAAGRERPNYTDDSMKFQPFNFKDSYNSMPSGDTAIAWSMITPYAIYYKQPLLYLIPVAVNFERVYKNKHWASDTLVGMAIGFSIGYLFSENHLSKKFKKFTFSGSPVGEGVVLNVKF